MEKKYMERAIELAKRGRGFVSPNPCVGAVIVRDGRIIAEGYHRVYGSLHAERDAFSRLANASDAEGADMYVTLEPCCHHGKQPPCTEAIIEHGIKRVFVGSDDPNPLVAGKGIEILRAHGIEVITHFMKEECDALNDIFFHFITKNRPYVVMKYAMTLDGKIATHNGLSQWISGEESRAHAHRLRHELSSIMVGSNTVSLDNPTLNCRIEGCTNPIRIVCDSHLSIAADCNLVATAKDIPLIVAHVDGDLDKAKLLTDRGVTLIKTPSDNSQVDLNFLLDKLGEMKIDSLLLEGGGTLNESFLKAGLVNHLNIYLAPKIFGGAGNYTPVKGAGVDSPDKAWHFKQVKSTPLGEDILLEYEPDII